jgi:hypothetical protein
VSNRQLKKRERVGHPPTWGVVLSGVVLIFVSVFYPAFPYPLTFEWNEAGGFKSIYCPLKPIPVVGTLYESIIVFQSRRIIVSGLRKADWKSARGTFGMVRVGLLPIVLGVSGEDDTTLIDPYETDLMRAAARGDKELVRELLSRGADVNASSQRGYTPLIYACMGSDSVEVIKMLVVAGANVNARDKSGQTALLWAMGSPHRKEILAVLIAAGADVNVQDVWGRTALSRAGGYDSVEVVQMLKAAGANR